MSFCLQFPSITFHLVIEQLSCYCLLVHLEVSTHHLITHLFVLTEKFAPHSIYFAARILRAIRIAARLGFSFSRETAHFIKNLSCSILRLDKV